MYCDLIPGVHSFRFLTIKNVLPLNNHFHPYLFLVSCFLFLSCEEIISNLVLRAPGISIFTVPTIFSLRDSVFFSLKLFCFPHLSVF